LSRKIAGPIFALRRHLDRVADGETDGDLRFPKDGWFTELQKTFNRHMDAYRKQLAVVRCRSLFAGRPAPVTYPAFPDL